MSKQTSILPFKGFKRTIVHQGHVLDISNQPSQKRKLLKCPHCDETFKSIQEFYNPCKMKTFKREREKNRQVKLYSNKSRNKIILK